MMLESNRYVPTTSHSMALLKSSEWMNIAASTARTAAADPASGVADRDGLDGLGPSRLHRPLIVWVHSGTSGEMSSGTRGQLVAPLITDESMAPACTPHLVRIAL